MRLLFSVPIDIDDSNVLGPSVSIFPTIQFFCTLPFAISLVYIIICIIIKNSSDNEEKKIKMENSIKSAKICLIVSFFIAWIPTILQWTLHAFNY